MSPVNPLPATALYHDCDPKQFQFDSTAELEDLTEIIGQTRALEAIRFGIGIAHEGYNLFMLGPNGTGKYTAANQFLKQRAEAEPTPDDWCYVYNFQQPHKPLALRLPPGSGTMFSEDMEQLVEDLKTVIPAAFDSDEYQAQKNAIEAEVEEKQSSALEKLKQQAEAAEIALIRTPSGFAFAPTKDENVISPEQFRELPLDVQERIETNVKALQESLQDIMQQVPHWQREAQGRVKKLNEEVALFAITPLASELQQKYSSIPAVLEHLKSVSEDVVGNVDSFLDSEATPFSLAQGLMSTRDKAQSTVTRYKVNVVVDHGDSKGAPVVYEDQPTYNNLLGRVEHVSQMGTLLTDFSLIKPGVLHKANGGYLILDARKLLMQPFAWEGLKHALRARQIRIESIGQMASVISTVSLEPEPIPLSIKVVLLGERLLYYLMHQHDPDFVELFKVAADFEDHMDRDSENNLAYARLISTLARKEQLLSFDPTGVARVIEQSARLAEDSEKLSTHMQSISDLLRESSYWAAEHDGQVVKAEDVQRAIEANEFRLGRVRERMQEQILRETILIDTDGSTIGQINGLAVFSLGNFAFGRPSRITARIRLGKGEVIDIERQVEMGGPIHSKGVLILSSFLGSRYAADRPLSLSASLVFEQSYSGVEGDSASSAELYALLSALADIPIKQGLAVTGSVNQRGQVQAIGGVNEKIEGFFDLCVARGLTGDQGVLIPASNVKHLMLRQDVVAAVAEQQFYVYPVTTVDEGIELLTGLPAGNQDEEGNYPPESINGLVTARLSALAERQRAFAAPATEPESEEE
jgi:lon-related putative ATP-dependent protease